MNNFNDEDHLTHHGILGQKWGKRNGPPYPLFFSRHSAAEKRANPKNKLDNYSKEKDGYRISVKVEKTKSQKSQKSQKLIKEKKPNIYSEAKKLSNEDLKSRTERLKAEKNYIELSSRDITQGRAYADSLLVNFGTTTMNSFVKTFGASIGAKSGTTLANLIFGGLNKSEKKAVKNTIKYVTEDAEKVAEKIDKGTKDIREAVDVGALTEIKKKQ